MMRLQSEDEQRQYLLDCLHQSTLDAISRQSMTPGHSSGVMTNKSSGSSASVPHSQSQSSQTSHSTTTTSASETGKDASKGDDDQKKGRTKWP